MKLYTTRFQVTDAKIPICISSIKKKRQSSENMKGDLKNIDDGEENIVAVTILMIILIIAM